MVFRRIYWVTEQLDHEGKSHVTGIYTSIPDLIEHGLRRLDGMPTDGFRVSLIKLDSPKEPLGVWTGPAYAGIEDDIQAYVQSREFAQTDVEQLGATLREFSAQ